MPVIVKFIVANEANAHIVSQLTTEYYSKVFPDGDKKEYSVAAFLNSSSSFTREWLMSFEVTGEDDERIEEALAFLELVSSNMPKEIKGEKPLYIEKVILSRKEDGFSEVLKRAVEIANQRKHDSLWIRVPVGDDSVIAFLNEEGFSKAGELSKSALFKKVL